MVSRLEKGFYAIVDPDACRGKDPIEVTEAVLKGGCAALQLRAKTLPDAERLRMAQALRERCRRADVPFFVNDRCDIARLVDADGVHLGQEDLPVAAARSLLPRAWLGRSTHDTEQADRALGDGVDLLAFGPVFRTHSKLRPDPVVGVSQLARICASSPVPVIAIGGITRDNIDAVVAAGASFACAIAAVCGAADPERAAAQLHAAFQKPR